MFKIPLKCVWNTEIEYNDISSFYNENEIYIADSQSIDKTKWWILNEKSQQFNYVDKHKFEIVVNQYLKHHYYGDYQMPIIGKYGQSWICLTPTGWTTHIHEDDVLEKGQYKISLNIDSSKIRFP